MSRVWFVVFGVVLLGGCGRRNVRAALPDMTIPVRCASEIRLMGCDARVSPPRCKSVRVSYREGCEEIAVRGK